MLARPVSSSADPHAAGTCDILAFDIWAFERTVPGQPPVGSPGLGDEILSSCAVRTSADLSTVRRGPLGRVVRAPHTGRPKSG